MVKLELLENNDAVRSDDFCRPLGLSFSESDRVYETSEYSGKPINNLKWVVVREVFGDCWFGKTVAEINGGETKHEFVRGGLPESHCLKGR
jgi:hypothetical protein